MSFHNVLLGALAILHVLVIVRVLWLEQRNPYSRAAWLLLLLFLPLIGVVLYVLFGEAWVSQHTRQIAKRDWQNLASNQITQQTETLTHIPERYHAAFLSAACINRFSVCQHNHMLLTADSNAAIAAMIADFHTAQSTIHISFYIWLTDGNGSSMVDAVCAAAKRGVTCRIMVDAIGSHSLIQSPAWQRMQTAGVKLGIAMHHRWFGNPFHANRIDLRNHRKIVVVDDAITYCGSQNCADPEFRIKAKYAPWVDIMARFEGEVVAQNQLLFVDSWENTTGEHIAQHAATPNQLAGDLPAIAFGTGPLTPEGAMSDVFVAVITSAQQEVVVSTPYFVPDQALMAALIATSRRGVDVRLVMPARNDSPFVAAMSRAYYAQLLDAGVRIFEFHGGLLHAKTVVVDAQLVLIGSANMDRRSLDLNFENNIVFHQIAAAKQIRQRQQTYLAHSSEFTVAQLRQRPWYQIIWQNALTLFEPIF